MYLFKKLLGSEFVISNKSKIVPSQNHASLPPPKIDIPENIYELVQTHSMTNLTAIVPKEVLMIIFSFLDAPSLLSISECCKLFYTLCRNITLWKSVTLSKHCLTEKALPYPVEKNFNWKSYYRLKALITQAQFMSWQWIPPSSDYPSKRHCHTGVYVGDDLIVYIGGQNAHDSRFDDVYHFDTNKKKFTRANVANVPNFSKHSAVALNGLIYLFGGFDGFQTKYDLAIYNPRTFEWTVPTNVNGEIPLSRSNHRVGLVGTKMYMFGGIRGGDDGNLDDLNDFYVLEITTLTWRKINGKGTIPAPRSGHLMAAIGTRLYVFGGGSGTGSSHKWDKKHSDIFVFDTETEIWTELKFPLSSKKNGISIYSAYFTIGPFIFVYGGEQLDTLNRKELSKDLYVLDTVLLEWIKIDVNVASSINIAISGSSAPKARDTSVFTLTSDSAYLSHGYNSEPLSDFWQLKFKQPLVFDCEQAL